MCVNVCMCIYVCMYTLSPPTIEPEKQNHGYSFGLWDLTGKRRNKSQASVSGVTGVLAWGQQSVLGGYIGKSF